ncbi:TetR-like C-terminal domain-containing protein [Nonomuraea typhae]|uniref:TetR-like C-terminal domain-containing protein n=1 Tax=Nonomuraea typhae TaxID=2603600 RepID=A0ABW7Z141_9ACTN
MHTSLVEALERGRDTASPEDPAGRILAWALAFREWSLANPQGFRLIYGDPVPGYRVPEGGAAPEAQQRTCMGLTGLVAAAWPRTEPLRPGGGYDWSDFDDDLAGKVRAEFPALPPAGLAEALRMWGRLHGPLALEVYGHLRGMTHDPAKVYRDEIANLIGSLGLKTS